jgi:hypothetical protein
MHAADKKNEWILLRATPRKGRKQIDNVHTIHTDAKERIKIFLSKAPEISSA